MPKNFSGTEVYRWMYGTNNIINMNNGTKELARGYSFKL